MKAIQLGFLSAPILALSVLAAAPAMAAGPAHATVVEPTANGCDTPTWTTQSSGTTYVLTESQHCNSGWTMSGGGPRSSTISFQDQTSFDHQVWTFVSIS